LESIQEWSDFMKTSSTWNFRSIVGKIMMGLVLASMIGSIDVLPALGRDNYRGRGYEHGRYYDHGRYYRPYGYYGHRERVYYPPPPVVWAPPPPPGVGIFFPPFFIR
jgi:hypothetical protein